MVKKKDNYNNGIVSVTFCKADKPTKSITLTAFKWKIILTILFIFLAWFVFSNYSLISLYKTNESLTSKNIKNLNVIYNYEVESENIFAKSYPEQKVNVSKIKTEKEVKKEKLTEILSPQKNKDTSNFIISMLSGDILEKKLIVNFKISNKLKKKQNGWMWILVTYIDKNNNKVFLHKNIGKNKLSKVVAERFTIKSFVNKQYVFNLTEGIIDKSFDVKVKIKSNKDISSYLVKSLFVQRREI